MSAVVRKLSARRAKAWRGAGVVVLGIVAACGKATHNPDSAARGGNGMSSRTVSAAGGSSTLPEPASGSGGLGGAADPAAGFGPGGEGGGSSGGVGANESSRPQCQDPLVFADPVLEQQLRDQIPGLGIPVRAAAAANIKQIFLQGSLEITDLTGIECFPSMETLHLQWVDRLRNVRTLRQLPELNRLEIELEQLDDAQLANIGSIPKLTTLSLEGRGLSDLSGLAPAKLLKSLAVQNGRHLSQISGLEALDSLQALLLGSVDLRDLGPLRGLPLMTLSIDAAHRLSDLEPLATLVHLATLTVKGTSVEDLSPLGELTGLTSLDLSDNRIEDLTPLASAELLSRLTISNNLVRDLSPLTANSRLRELTADHNRIEDLSPLAGLPMLLQALLSENAIRDLSPLLSGPGLSFGSTLSVSRQMPPMDCESQLANIKALEARGTSVYVDCPH